MPVKKKVQKKVPTKSAVAAGRAAPRRKPKAEAKPAPRQVTPEERYKMIELAAYYRAERMNWQVDPVENWLAAEKEIDAQLRGEAPQK